MAQLAEKEDRLCRFFARGGGLLPNSRLLGMCLGWGRILTTGLIIIGCIFIRVTRMGPENSGMWGFKNRKTYSTLRLTNASVNFRMTKLKGLIR